MKSEHQVAIWLAVGAGVAIVLGHDHAGICLGGFAFVLALLA